MFTLASGLSTKDVKIQSATLLHVIDSVALEVYNTFTWASNDGKQKVDMILEKFEGHCIPCTSVTRERHIFNAHNQHDNETI